MHRGRQCEETQRIPYEDGGRDWRDMSIGHGTSKIGWQPPEARRKA